MNKLLQIVACLSVILPAVSVHSAETPPNILLITSEDNGPELGCYGDPYAQTPRLDKLAEEGVRFERAFVVTASCSESRSALLTGLFPHQNGQIGLATHHYRQFEGVPNVVSALKSAGYRTGLIGKLHVNPESAFPFDYRPGDAVDNSFRSRDVASVASAAATFFAQGDGPFFLMVNFADAHLPFLTQSHGLPKDPLSAEDVKPLPWIGLDTPGLRQAQADYYNCMSRLDTGVGMLLDTLKEAGHAEDTLVVYLGDHGAQFPRGKLASYESSLRIPLLICWSGRTTGATVRNELVSSLDITRTLYTAAGVKPRVELPGRSLQPLLGRDEVPWRTYLHTEYHAHYPPLFFPQRTVRDERYKLIVNLVQDRPNPVAHSYSQTEAPRHPSYVRAADVETGSAPVRRAYATWLDAPPFELYDLKMDPFEFENKADDPALASIKKRLMAELEGWQTKTADPLKDPESLRRLTEEHDALPRPYVRDPQQAWGYVKYLRE